MFEFFRAVVEVLVMLPVVVGVVPDPHVQAAHRLADAENIVDLVGSGTQFHQGWSRGRHRRRAARHAVHIAPPIPFATSYLLVGQIAELSDEADGDDRVFWYDDWWFPNSADRRAFFRSPNPVNVSWFQEIDDAHDPEDEACMHLFGGRDAAHGRAYRAHAEFVYRQMPGKTELLGLADLPDSRVRRMSLHCQRGKASVWCGEVLRYFPWASDLPIDHWLLMRAHLSVNNQQDRGRRTVTSVHCKESPGALGAFLSGRNFCSSGVRGPTRLGESPERPEWVYAPLIYTSRTADCSPVGAAR